MSRLRFLRRLIPGRRAFKLLLYTLPLTFWPLLTGIHEGILFEIFTQRHNAHLKSRFEFEHEMDVWSDAWSVPGAPGIHDLPVAPFHLVPLRNTRWWTQLNLSKPLEDYDAAAHFHRWAAPDGLWAEDDLNSPQMHWVYIAKWGFSLFDPWDVAFDRLLQYHYVHPPAGGASISYIDPGKASFLSGVWAVEAPALVLFKLDKSRIDFWGQPYTPRKSWRGLRMYPVSVRVVELGLKSFKPGVFPDRFEQMLFLTSGEHDVDELEEWDALFQSIMIYGNWYRDLVKTSTVLTVIKDVDDWIERTFPMLHEVLGLLTLLVFALVAVIASLPRVLFWGLLHPLWQNFAGAPEISEDVAASLFKDATDDEKMARHPLLGGAIAAFLENVTNVFQAQMNASVSEAATSAVTSSATL